MGPGEDTVNSLILFIEVLNYWGSVGRRRSCKHVNAKVLAHFLKELQAVRSNIEA